MTAKRLLRGVVPAQERQRLQDLIPNGIHPIGLTPQSVGDQRFRWSRANLWAWLDLNQRPHPERKIPRVMRRGFEGDVVAEGLELGNGPTRFSSLVAAPGHGGLIRDGRLGAVLSGLFAARADP